MSEEMERYLSQYTNPQDRRYAKKMWLQEQAKKGRKGEFDEPDYIAEFEQGIEDGTITSDEQFKDYIKRRRKEVEAKNEVQEICSACDEKTSVFVVKDLAVGPRSFCSEEHYALFMGLPVKPEGYYGFIKIGEENGNRNREEKV
jgi:hypothetical protein